MTSRPPRPRSPGAGGMKAPVGNCAPAGAAPRPTFDSKAITHGVEFGYKTAGQTTNTCGKSAT